MQYLYIHPKRMKQCHGLSSICTLFIFLAPFIPATAQSTGAVYGAYDNELVLPPGHNLPLDRASSATFFNGSVFVLEAAPTDGSVHQVHSSFGQMISHTIPYPNFQQDSVDRASRMLYYEDADDTPDYKRQDAAFRYLTLLFGRDGDNNTIAALFENMDTYWTIAERTRAREAARVVMNALKYDPMNTALQDIILDILYYTAVAEKQLAAEQVAQSRKESLGPELGGVLPAFGSLSINNEIKELRKAIPIYTEALKGYFSLFIDPLGVNTQSIDMQAVPGTPYGYYIFQKRVPYRSLFSASFRDGDPHPLLDEFALLDIDFNGGLSFEETQQAENVPPPTDNEFNALDLNGDGELCRNELEKIRPLIRTGNNDPQVLFNGYKDAVLLFEVMRDRMRAMTDLARLYGLRGNQPQGETPGDIELAINLIARGQQQGFNDGNLLLGVWDSMEGADPRSGLSAAIGGWGNGMRELVGVHSFLEGDANPLGLDKDFLALVDLRAFGDTEGHFSTYDYIMDKLDWQNTRSPLAIALQKFDIAKQRYLTVRINLDTVTAELSAQKNHYDMRLASIVGVSPTTSAGVDNPEYQEFGNLNLNDLPDNPKYKGGEIAIQVLYMQNAVKQIERNAREIKNLEDQVLIEIDRRGKEQGINNQIANTYTSYAGKYANIQRSIAQYQAAQAAASAMAAGISNWLFSCGASTAAGALNASIQAGAELAKGDLLAKRELLQGFERADIQRFQDQLAGIESEARIKTLMPGMGTLAIESEQACLMLAAEQAKIQALINEKERLEARRLEARQELGGRYVADPAHRVLLQQSILEAHYAFREAQLWVFYAAQALNYKYNSSFVAQAPGGGEYTAASIFALRNAEELKAMYQAMDSWAGPSQMGTREASGFKKFSLREDYLGYRRQTVNGAEITYPDPATGESVTAIEAFRSYLANHTELLTPQQGGMNSDATVRRLKFSTNIRRPGTGHFSQNRWNEKIRRVTLVFVSQQTRPLGGDMEAALEISGDGYLRRQMRGEPDATRPDIIRDEMTIRPISFFEASLVALPAPASGQVWTWIRREHLRDRSVSSVWNTADSDVPPAVTGRTTFNEYPVAISQWTLDFPVQSSQDPVIVDINQLQDIQLWLDTRYYLRQTNKVVGEE